MLFRKAGPGDCAQAQEIIRLARERMGRQGNPQWQDGYPADEDVRHDIEAGNGYVLCLHNRPVEREPGPSPQEAKPSTRSKAGTKRFDKSFCDISCFLLSIARKNSESKDKRIDSPDKILHAVR